MPLKTADYSGLSDAELVAKLDELTDHMRYQWWIHGHINFVLLSSSAFCDLYDEVVQPAEPTEAYQTLQGFHDPFRRRRPRPVDAEPHRQGQPRRCGELFATIDPRDLPAALDATEEGQAFRQRARRVPLRVRLAHDAVYDLADVPWREDPTIPLASIAGFVELDDSEDPELVYQQRVARREQLLANLRTKLADDPDTLAKFEELYEAARYSFPLTEDHAFYIDQLYISVFRRFVLAVGRAARRQGGGRRRRRRLLPLPRRGRRRPDRTAVTDGRRWPSAEPASSGPAGCRPPTALGTPPPPPEVPDPFMDALVYRLLGIVPPEENTDPDVLKAVAGSPGVYTGTARVVRSLAEALDDLEDGEVMVCEMTLPPWVPLFSIAGAVVSDVGGVLSHSAIVAREFGLPAVVGTNVGTTVIKTGQTITVDGTKGIVYLDGAPSRRWRLRPQLLRSQRRPVGEGAELRPHDRRVDLRHVRGT